MGILTVTMLGCGTSVGIPCLGRAGWGKCDPNEPKNRRQRCALLVQTETTNILVDAGPDIRNQLLPHNLTKIDAVLITHTHSDHVAGLDDLRVFYWPDQIKVPLYAAAHHGSDITGRVPYMFEKNPSSPSYFQPPLEMRTITAGEAIEIGDVNINVLYQKHGLTDSLGFISIDGLYRAMGETARNGDNPQFCDACFTGDYPIKLASGLSSKRVSHGNSR